MCNGAALWQQRSASAAAWFALSRNSTSGSPQIRRASGSAPSSSAQAAIYQALRSGIGGDSSERRGWIAVDDKCTVRAAEAPRSLDYARFVLEHLQGLDEGRLTDFGSIAGKNAAFDTAGAVASGDAEID